MMEQELLVYCSYCKRRRVDGVWVDALPPPREALVSHGICEQCYEKVVETLEEGNDGTVETGGK